MKKRFKKSLWVVTLIVVLVIAYVAVVAIRPLKPVSPAIKPTSYKTVTTASSLSWPAAGESAMGILGTNIAESSTAQTPLPTASTAKLITALMVLKKYPLTGTEQGPTYTFTDNDVNIYNSYAAEGGSVVYIVDGETITEHQMLEAMLLPSGNNIADTMAIWAYGSLSAYATAANQFLDEQGITHTHVGVDASGYDPSSTSTPADLVKIGELVMQNSALKDIVAEPSTNDIPGIGTAYNVDTLIGQDGIVGIKTGNNDQDLGVFVGASNQSVGGKNIVILTATMGQASLANAFNSTQALVSSSVSNIKGVTLVPSGTEIGAYVGGNTNVPIVAASDLSAEVWGGGIVVSRPSKVDNITNPTADHTKVGNMVVTGQVLASSPINLVTNQSYNKPTLTWKLLHPGSVKF